MESKAIWTEPVLGLNRQRLIERCREAIVAGREDSFIYLVPTGALLRHVTAQILDGQRVRACRELRVFLFDGLIQRILKHAGEERRFIRDGIRYFLLERIIGQLAAAGALQHIPAIALLPGTIESVSKLIGEIKRAGMLPDAFREFVSIATPQPRDLDVAAIYEAYQRLLDERALMDADEAAVRAFDILRTRPNLPPWLNWTTTLFVDGFYDFTPIQKQLLRYLIERIPEVIVNLTYDPRNPYVFEEPLRETLKFLDSLSQPMPTEHFAETLPYEPALTSLRAALFNPIASISPEHPPITILAAATMSHEVQEIAKEIKQLIVERGYHPHQIAVVAREPSSYLEAVHEELDRMRIPSALNTKKSLTSLPPVRAALKVLDGRVAHDQTDPYLALLKNDYLEHFGLLDRDAIENAVLAVGAQVALGPWRQRVKDMRRLMEYQADRISKQSAGAEATPPELLRAQRRLAQLDAALSAVNGMRKAVDHIPERGTLSELTQGFLSALRAFGLWERLHEQLKQARTESELRLLSRDVRALQLLRRSLEELQLSVPETGEPLTVEQFRNLITHMLQRTTLNVERGDLKGVQLLEATRARNLSFRAVLIAGLTEGQFPMAPERDWIYPHQEREKLAEAGLFLKDLSPRSFEAKEACFFYLAACQATERLYLTYPRSSATGEQNVISSFMEEVQRLYHNGHDTLVPTRDISPSTYEVRRVASMPEATRALLAGLYQTTPDDRLVMSLYNHAIASGIFTSSIFKRLQIEEHRQGSAFGAFDGVLTDVTIQQQLRQWFGLNRIYSASELNTYGRCPFQFFSRHVLRLEEREEASLDLIAAERGWLMHTILHNFLRRYLGANLTWARRQEYHEELTRVAQSAFDRYKQAMLPMNASLWELQTTEILHTLRRFLDAEIQYQAQVSAQGVRPHWLDLSFGMPADQEQEHSNAHPQPLVLQRDQDTIKLRGRIDRVDRSTDGKYILYDYKSGSGTEVKEIQAGLDLQMQLFISAFKDTFLKPGEAVIGGGYYSLKDLDRKRGLYRKEFQSYTGINPRASSNMSTDEWEAVVGGATDFAWHYVDGMRAGDFRVAPKDDSYCPQCSYQTVCRYEKHRIRAKTKTDEVQ
ncbi:MAG: PD-(D/E)XK nuclease family protein [Acidobacteria bacterium]|nr:PD-(D/E)XK nuclease family protein [Acidobacteriota bacterium]